MNRNESETRADLISPKLALDGWGTTERSIIRREFGITAGRILGGGKRASSLSSDYVLEFQGRKLAAVEAKRESLSYTEGVRQAKDYAQRLQCRFAYATNGHDIYQIDMLTGFEQLVDNYLSPADMWRLCFEPVTGKTEPDYTATWRTRFAQIPFEFKGDWQPRYYQENAINQALEAIALGKDRILLALATGTGKTCIAFQTAWKLFHSRWSLQAAKNPSNAKKRPRILFLADRNILTKQAFNDFGAFGEDAVVRITPSEIKKAKGVPKNASIFMAIFQTLMTDSASNPTNDSDEEELPEDEDYSLPIVTDTSNCNFRQYPEDFFDFIIIDECHRGGANDESSWRDILNYFAPAVQLGLTATPKRTDNVDSYKYFGEPVYSYTLKEGINDGFLTPFKVYPIVGTMDEYQYTPGDAVTFKGEPEAGRVYKEGDFNRIITMPQREQKRVHYWMDHINPHDKTIVFCGTQEHAGMVRDYINQYAVQKGWTTNPTYCVRITANDGAAGENDLRTFCDNEKTIPTILTTSRKLSTGVDARNVRNIVLMRPCNNMIEFKQIIGRGTRLYDGKSFFTVYDFVKAHHNFADPEWDGEPLPPKEKPDEQPCDICNVSPCICICEVCGFNPCNCKDDTPNEPCGECNQSPCQCLTEPCNNCGDTPCSCNTDDDDGNTGRPDKIFITLTDGKVRQIQHMKSVLFMGADGEMLTAKQFVEQLFGDLPRFFGNEDELRQIWSNPSTREKLLTDLYEAGYDDEKLDSMKDIIDAKDSDVYDLLAFVAYAKDTHTRKERVATAKPGISSEFTYKQVEFIEFILDKYIEDGVQELAAKKMRSLVELKYNTISDAAAEFGSPAAIRDTFIGFQKHLYQ
ncbi:type III restriction enzyme, res subunit [Psychromonas ingrahamii 37]|uniref:Type III restriction enzyme, res subunit n=1 Tax=Psychromonas ingrahamii (strain DSM 17664 / CCUG 51855 / 37) TaxID=357804 RepID=A1SRA3_PSYIN|nr:type I restriction endonuclease subunit R [Psychromonas ingrahamii]ABM02018.1 type III restriction enzyme, res subunit [Psychromonas ingrahamii 37]